MDSRETLFSLGEAVAVIGILIALYQIMSSSWKLNWRVHRRYRLSVIGLISLGYTMPFISSVVGEGVSISKVQLSAQSLQIAGYILITLGLLDFIRLLRFGSTRLLRSRGKVERYKNGRAARFYRHVNRSILEADYKTAADAVCNNMQDLILMVEKFHQPFPDEAESGNPVYSEYAYELLHQLFTDKNFMQYVVTERLDFIYIFVKTIEESPYVMRYKDACMHELVDALFKDSRSFLYRHSEKYRGASRAVNVYDLIFGNRDILGSANLFDTMRDYEIMNNHLSVEIDDYVNVLIMAIEEVLDVYKAEDEYPEGSFRNLKRGIFELLEVSERLCYWGNRREKLGDTDSREYQAFLKIRMFISHFNRELWQDATEGLKQRDREVNASKQNQYDITSATTLGAFAAAELMKHITVADRNDGEMAYSDALDILHDFEGNIPQSVLYRKIMWEYLFEQIDDNLNGRYPAVLRNVIAVMTVIMGGKNRGHSPAEKDAWKKLKGILRGKLATAIRNKKIMADDKTLYRKALLPSNLVAKITNNKVDYYHKDRKGKLSKLSI